MFPTYSPSQSESNVKSHLDPSSFGPSPNLTFILVPTTSSPTNDGLDLSLPAVKAANISTGGVANLANMVVNASGTPEWSAVGDVEGWRIFWVVGGLLAQTNYTAWVMDDNGRLSQPVWFSTKEG